MVAYKLVVTQALHFIKLEPCAFVLLVLFSLSFALAFSTLPSLIGL